MHNPFSDARTRCTSFRLLVRIIFLTLLTVLLTQCRGAAAPEATFLADGETTLPFATLTKGTYSGDPNAGPESKRPSITILVDAHSIERTHRGLLPGAEPMIGETDYKRPIGSVTYTDSIGILIMHGVVGSGGYHVTIEAITLGDSTVRIYTRFDTPKPGTFQTQAFTNPRHYVAISREPIAGKRVTFELLERDRVLATVTHDIP